MSGRIGPYPVSIEGIYVNRVGIYQGVDGYNPLAPSGYFGNYSIEICDYYDNTCTTPLIFTAVTKYSGPPPVYEWWRNGVVIPDSNSPILTLDGQYTPGINEYKFWPASGDQFYVKVFSNSLLYSVQSPLITVNITPVILSQFEITPSIIPNTPPLTQPTEIVFNVTAIGFVRDTTYFKFYVNSVLIQNSQAPTFTYTINPGDTVLAELDYNSTACSGGLGPEGCYILITATSYTFNY